MKLKYITNLVLSLYSSVIWAQSDFDLSQRWLNESVYNPAATASAFTTGVFLHGRTQWMGLAGAPRTQVVGFDTYIDHLKSGVGMIITGDQIGLSTAYSGKISYAYHIGLSEKSFIAMGLSVGMFNRNLNPHDALADDLDDPILSSGSVSDFAPDFGLGIEFKSPLRLGLAVRHWGSQTSNSRMSAPAANIWAYASSRINLQSFSIEPSISAMHRTDITRYEAGVIGYFAKVDPSKSSHDRFWVGAMYRLHGQSSFLVGISLNSQLKVGYSFDYGLGSLARISSYGTHEIYLSWQFVRIFYRDEICPAYKQSKKNVYKRLKW